MGRRKKKYHNFEALSQYAEKEIKKMKKVKKGRPKNAKGTNERCMIVGGGWYVKRTFGMKNVVKNARACNESNGSGSRLDKKTCATRIKEQEKKNLLTDSLSLFNEAFMRSGLRGGGSGGSEAAIVGPEDVPFICIIY